MVCRPIVHSSEHGMIRLTGFIGFNTLGCNAPRSGLLRRRHQRTTPAVHAAAATVHRGRKVRVSSEGYWKCVGCSGSYRFNGGTSPLRGTIEASALAYGQSARLPNSMVYRPGTYSAKKTAAIAVTSIVPTVLRSMLPKIGRAHV